MNSLPFSLPSRALKSQTSGCSPRWHWDMQAGVPHHCDISQPHPNKLFFSLVFPCSSPSVPHAVSIFHHHFAIAGIVKYLSPESENVMPTLLTVLSQLSLCTFLWGAVLSHTISSTRLVLVLTSTPETAFKTLIKASLHQSPS